MTPLPIAQNPELTRCGEIRWIFVSPLKKKSVILGRNMGRGWQNRKKSHAARATNDDDVFPELLHYKVELAGFHTKVRHMSVALPQRF